MPDIRSSLQVIKPTVTEEVLKDDMKYSRPVKIIDLEEYVKQAIENGEFENQHGVMYIHKLLLNISQRTSLNLLHIVSKHADV